MSNRTKRQRRNAVEDTAIKRLLRCPDCPATVQIERDRYGDRTLFVTHLPSCPRIPAAQRAQGLNTFVTTEPQLHDINALRGDDDEQAP